MWVAVAQQPALGGDEQARCWLSKARKKCPPGPSTRQGDNGLPAKRLNPGGWLVSSGLPPVRSDGVPPTLVLTVQPVATYYKTRCVCANVAQTGPKTGVRARLVWVACRMVSVVKGGDYMCSGNQRWLV